MPRSISSARKANQIRVMIVDDHAVIRAGLQMLIEQDQTMTVVALAGNRAETLDRATKERPDIIVLDLLLGEDDGLAFLPELREATPDSRVLVLTGVQNPDLHRRAIRRGAMGIVLKEHAAELLLKAIKKVHAGEVWIDRSMMGIMIEELNKPYQADPETLKINTLTPREREVIGLVGEGLKNKQIAERLFISETTVTHHLSSVFSKLEVSDRLELMIYSFRHGLAKAPG
ncbi:MAG TPA: response regulator transcription factor [Pyrinomonadaceae bacterium]|nr:response regulator transcription factor [Pyrinomonadaceae bacterium]